MKVAIVNNMVPFIYGGAEFLADSLKDKLIEYGHEAQVIRIPFNWDPPEKIIEHMFASRLLRLDTVDKVIALKFPAYYIKHPNKTLWLLHQFRQAYDLWGTEYQCIPNNEHGLKIRNAIIESDNRYIGELKGKIYTNSKVVSDRLMKFNNIDSQILYPPLMEAEKFYCNEYGDYIFYPSRISHYKRQHIAIEAMKYTKTDVKLVIAGKGDTSEDVEFIKKIVKDNRLENKVQIIDRFISQKEKADYFANCVGCTYIPYDEDSYGYVTLESYHSKKPVITFTDSGGTNVVVKDGETGYMVEPNPKALAEAIDKLYLDKKNARIMGEQGLKNLDAIGIKWDYVIERLLK